MEFLDQHAHQGLAGRGQRRIAGLRREGAGCLGIGRYILWRGLRPIPGLAGLVEIHRILERSRTRIASRQWFEPELLAKGGDNRRMMHLVMDDRTSPRI